MYIIFKFFLFNKRKVQRKYKTATKQLFIQLMMQRSQLLLILYNISLLIYPFFDNRALLCKFSEALVTRHIRNTLNASSGRNKPYFTKIKTHYEAFY